ncbi:MULTISPECIES: hypothetical protein [Pectobacterium]|uniref:Uncharacterized protein n=1 Tax=Pectobacterium carotovorum TaxID=554 RepID=A0A419ARW2_PECCA|nr:MULTISPECIES: hypothetical protein [Pectobacterium]RJL48212.1 hypothetical protein D5071_18600 [Pectobacterium carotovorum]
MVYYSIRKNRSNNLSIISFKKSFFKLIENEDGWVIRVFIYILLHKIKLFKPNAVFDFDSEDKINDIIKKNGEYHFNDSVCHLISEAFIDGLRHSTVKDSDVIFTAIKVFFIQSKLYYSKKYYE